MAAVVVAVALPAAALLAGCAPDTHLFDEGRGGRAPAPPRAGLSPDTGAPAPAGPPALLAFTVTLAADCVRVRAEASVPAAARVRFQAGDQVDERPMGEGASLFDQAFRLPGLPVGAEAEATVSMAGLTSEPARFRVPAAPALPLVVSEVLPNPAGAETSQEYVELRNVGEAPVALEGLAIEDEAGRDVLPAGTLAPGAFALVVGASFVDGAPGDVPPRPGTLLLRVPGRIGRDGLRQQGESVRLVAADGGVISSYGGHVDTSRAAWSGRSVQRLPDVRACDHPQAWSMAPLDPTPGW
jgi:hypothetical protein